MPSCIPGSLPHQDGTAGNGLEKHAKAKVQMEFLSSLETDLRGRVRAWLGTREVSGVCC